MLWISEMYASKLKVHSFLENFLFRAWLEELGTGSKHIGSGHEWMNHHHRFQMEKELNYPASVQESTCVIISESLA